MIYCFLLVIIVWLIGICFLLGENTKAIIELHETIKNKKE